MTLAEQVHNPPKVDGIEDVITTAIEEVDAPEVEGITTGTWRVTNKGEADWALAKLAKARAARAEVEAIYHDRVTAAHDALMEAMAPVVEWRKEQVARYDDDEERWEALLLQYHRTLLADDDHAKTVELPHGTLKARKTPDRWDVDDDAFLAWAQDGQRGLVRVKQSPDKKAMRELLKVADDGCVVTEEGELVPGVTVERGEVRFTVETPEVAS
jgi:hypothetical protein